MINLLHSYGESRFFNAFTQLLDVQTQILFFAVKEIPVVESTSVIASSISCDSIYDISSNLSKRSTMLGYGQKIMPLQNKDVVPGVGKYDIESGIDPVKNRRKCISFGVSREVINPNKVENGVWGST